MAGLIESQRYELEEIDTIEDAISQRVRRNVDVLPENIGRNEIRSYLNSKKRPYQETLLQVNELKFLFDTYSGNCKKVKNFKDSDKDLKEEMSELVDSSHDFKVFDTYLNEIRNRYKSVEPVLAEDLKGSYAMYSSAPDFIEKGKGKKKFVKRRHILSQAAGHLDLDKVFTSNEFYGKYLDLNEFYTIFKQSTASELPYVDYLESFDRVPYSESFKSNTEYKSYLDNLVSYLKSFLRKTKPFFDVQSFVHNVDKLVAEKSNGSFQLQDATKNEKGEVYCAACDKLFTKDTVYQAHLSGKKHKKNTRAQSENLGSPAPGQTGRLEIIKKESELNTLGNLLKDRKNATIANCERKYALTDREQLQEVYELRGEESDYTAVESSGEESDGNLSDSDDESPTYLPLGVDGTPIPFWLYKLQGLHKTFSCEICGNVTYKGSAMFSKHFGGVKHSNGLKLLGVPEDAMPLFKGVSKISEASDLWRRIKRERRIKEGDAENAIEFEDEEGNVMSEKDYLELKKQGLL